SAHTATAPGPAALVDGARPLVAISVAATWITGARTHFVSDAPFVQIYPVGLLPLLGAEGAAALMRQANGPGSKLESVLPRGPAKIHIVEVKLEPRVEGYFSLRQHRFFGRQEYTVDQFAGGGTISKVGNRPEWMLAMGDGAGQI